MPISLHELAEHIGATVEGDGSAFVSGCAPIDRAQADEITFLANKRYSRFLEETNAAAVLVDPKTECPDGLTRLVTEDPYFAFRNALIELHGFRRHPQPVGHADAGISGKAVVHPTATIGEGTVVHPHAVIERDAVVGARCVIYPGVYVGPEVRIGEECVLYPNVVVYDRCLLGNRVVLHANTVIGHDGFGFATSGGVHHKIPQTGIVVIEDDVDMGASCAVERAAMGETRIGTGTKLADVISIGHGTTTGRGCLLVSLVGVSGSVEMGDYVVLGGQVGIAGHLKIGSGVQAAAKCGIMTDIPEGQKVGGIPAQELRDAKRNVLVAMDLYSLAKRVRNLERELEKAKNSAER